jgi:hypothetical protein
VTYDGTIGIALFVNQFIVSTDTMSWIPDLPTTSGRSYKYLRYLKLIEKSIPLSILMYLKKEDLLQQFLSKSQREEYDELFDGVDTYFL